MINHDPVALRLQRLDLQTQTLVLAEFAARRTEKAKVSQASVTQLFHAFSLPAPAKIANVFTALTSKGLLTKLPDRGAYRVTPEGQARVTDRMTASDFLALAAESVFENAPSLGRTEHSLVSVTLAPLALAQPLRKFLADHPFDTNVFGMTRFPNAKANTSDPVGRALAVTKDVCSEHGLSFHLASDRALTEDLWANVTAHMWACRYGIAFFENRADRGINHNLLIEVGAMIVTGRRCALLKDGSIDNLPTDFVGMIYKSVDLDDEQSVATKVRDWIINDLSIKNT